MKLFSIFALRGVATVGLVGLLNMVALAPISAFGAEAPIALAADSATATNTDEADKAWKEVRHLIQPPMPPTEWQEKEPTEEEKVKFWTTALLKGADAAKDFYKKYPTHPKAPEAQKREYDLLTLMSRQFHDDSQAQRLAALEVVRLNDPNATPDEKLQLRIAAIQRLVNGLPGTREELEKGVRSLKKDFPQHPEAYYSGMKLLMEISEGDTAKSVAHEIMDSDAPDALKQMAKGALTKMEALGKPLNIHYTAVDGREVDLSKMKGKVVLIDFWATWCGPCMGELPNVKAAYEKLHPKGFEIVGISFDQDKDALQKTLKEKEMTWPQYFDGLGWGNKFGQQYGIEGIPTMWLVNKQGNLCDIEARGALEEKVTKLLAE